MEMGLRLVDEARSYFARVLCYAVALCAYFRASRAWAPGVTSRGAVRPR